MGFEDIRSMTPLGGGVSCDVVAVDLADRARRREAGAAQAARRRRLARPAGNVPRPKPPGSPASPSSTRGSCRKCWPRTARVISSSWRICPIRCGKRSSPTVRSTSPSRGRSARRWRASMRRPSRGGASTISRSSTRCASRPICFTPPSATRTSRRASARVAAGVAEARIAVMQGDVSPKNILVAPHGPVFLDAETACLGDPAFDLAFCLNHLLLKAGVASQGRGGAARRVPCAQGCLCAR